MAEKKVDNVKVTVEFSEEQELKELKSGEGLSVLMGKLAKAVKNIISHFADSVKHITADERAAWNGKAAGSHAHGVATSSANGFMSADDKTKLDGIATGANKYTHPTSAGNKHIPAGGASGQILRWSSDGTAEWGTDNNTTYGNMSGASASAAGKAGLVPAPAAGAQAKYLRGDGTWQTPPDTNTTYSAATQSVNGLMSAADKKKLDGIAASATSVITTIVSVPNTSTISTFTKPYLSNLKATYIDVDIMYHPKYGNLIKTEMVPLIKKMPLANGNYYIELPSTMLTISTDSNTTTKNKYININIAGSKITFSATYMNTSGTILGLYPFAIVTEQASTIVITTYN